MNLYNNVALPFVAAGSKVVALFQDGQVKGALAG